MLEKITIGTRGSDLALAQVDITKQALLQAMPSLVIDVKIITTEGDTNSLPIPEDVNGKGWFTKEIEAALADGSIDLAVHSLKDVADESNHGLVIDAYISRDDARDVLITKTRCTLAELPANAVIGTDSGRRQVQMLALMPDAQMESIRGNVPTRLAKLASQHYDAIILAVAGLNRLKLTDRIDHTFSIQEMTPAPGQGTLALQVRTDHTELREVLALINDAEVAHLVRLERSFSAAVGGGCKAPVGAYAYREGNNCVLVGMMLDEDDHILRGEISAPWTESTDLGVTLANQLKARP